MIALATITPDWELYEVWLDGVKIEKCLLADEEAGIAYCEKRTKSGLRSWSGFGLFDLELRRGRVELRFRGGLPIARGGDIPPGEPVIVGESR